MKFWKWVLFFYNSMTWVKPIPIFPLFCAWFLIAHQYNCVRGIQFSIKYITVPDLFNLHKYFYRVRKVIALYHATSVFLHQLLVSYHFRKLLKFVSFWTDWLYSGAGDYSDHSNIWGGNALEKSVSRQVVLEIESVLTVCRSHRICPVQIWNEIRQWILIIYVETNADA